MKHKIMMFSAILLTASAAANATPSRLEAAKDYLKNRYQTNGPGTVYQIGKKGKVITEGAFGLADVQWQIPHRSDVVFRLGSISKSITAVAVLDMVSQGKLALDVPIHTYALKLPAHMGAVRCGSY